MQLVGKFVGAATAKLTALITPKKTDAGLAYTVDDEAQIDMKFKDVGIQGKFKPHRLSLQTDFGQHSKSTKYGGNQYDFWFNPYILWETSRTFNKNSLWLGHLLHVNRFFRSNVSLQDESQCP